MPLFSQIENRLFFCYIVFWKSETSVLGKSRKSPVLFNNWRDFAMTSKYFDSELEKFRSLITNHPYQPVIKSVGSGPVWGFSHPSKFANILFLVSWPWNINIPVTRPQKDHKKRALCIRLHKHRSLEATTENMISSTKHDLWILLGGLYNTPFLVLCVSFLISWLFFFTYEHRCHTQIQRKQIWSHLSLLFSSPPPPSLSLFLPLSLIHCVASSQFISVCVCLCTRDDAEMEYLKIAQDLDMYGVNYFLIRVSRYFFTTSCHPKPID